MAFYDHYIGLRKGVLDRDQYGVTAAPASGVTIPKGSVVSLDANGNFVLGAGAGVLPYFAWVDSDAYDVVGGYRTNAVSTQTILGISGTAPYQIATSEFVADTYAPNTLLSAATGADAGKVKVRVATEDVIGVVTAEGQTTQTISVETSISVVVFWISWRPVLV